MRCFSRRLNSPRGGAAIDNKGIQSNVEEEHAWGMVVAPPQGRVCPPHLHAQSFGSIPAHLRGKPWYWQRNG